MEISIRKLAAALECAAKKDIRTYLEGVHINHRLNRLESTDGHCALIIEDAVRCETEDVKLSENIILHRTDVELAIKAAPKKGHPYLTFKIRGDGSIQLGKIITRALDYKFPEIQRVVPEKSEQCPSVSTTKALDLDLLMKWQKVQQKRGLPYKTWQPDFYTKPDKSEIQTIGDMMFIVMPMRYEPPVEMPE